MQYIIVLDKHSAIFISNLSAFFSGTHISFDIIAIGHVILDPVRIYRLVE